MAGNAIIIHPLVEWAQRTDKLYVTINVEDCKNPTLDIKEKSLHFKGQGGPDKATFECTLEFYKDVVPEECRYVLLPRHIPCMLKKKDKGTWPRLLKSTSKVHWLKTDFAKWRDEDDSDNDDKDDTSFEEMMKQMGNFSGAPKGDFDKNEKDSDEEGLPDLE